MFKCIYGDDGWWKADTGVKLTCGGREEDTEDGEEILSWTVIWHAVSAEQPRWIADEAVLWKRKSSRTQITQQLQRFHSAAALTYKPFHKQ